VIFEEPLSDRVALCLQPVDGTIDLNYQILARAAEVHDKRPDHMLPSKFRTKLSPTNGLPEENLTGG
jgi:hypothetical protein